MSVYADRILADTPVVYYQHEEASGLVVDDDSGTALDGAYTGLGVTYEAPGPLLSETSKAVTFDGIAGFASLSLTGSNRPTYPFVLEGWFKPTSATPTLNSVLMSMRSDDDVEYASIFVGASNRWGASVINSTGPTVASITTTTTITDEFHHLALRCVSAGEYRLYVDGVLAGSNTSDAPAWSGTKTSYTLSIANNGDGANFFGGSASRTAYYNADVSAARTAIHWRAAVHHAIYQAINAALQADADLVTAAGSRIFAEQMPRDAAFPGVRYALLADSPHQRLASDTNNTLELQVDAYADRGGQGEAWTINDLVRAALSRQNINAPGFDRVAVLCIQRGQPMAEPGLYRVRSQYRLFGSAA